MKKKILTVSWTLHPWPTGSSVIVNNIASQFSKDEMVLLGERYPGEEFSEWPEHYPEIYYVDPNLKIFGRGQTHLRWLRINKIINQIEEIIKKENIEKILCVYPDDFYLYASYVVSKSLKIPLYTWFHNTYYDNVMGSRKILAKWLQPKVFAHSKINFVMSDGMKNFYDTQYKNVDVKTLPHGFLLPESNTYQPLNIRDGKIKFVYTGNLNESCRDASIRILKTILSNPNYIVDVYSGTNKSQFEKWGISSPNFIVKGFIPLSELYQKLKEYHILLLPHGFDGGRTKVEFDTIFPTRTIPLLVSGRPILAHSPPGCFLTEFINRYECALNVDVKDIDEINLAIRKLIDDTSFVKTLTTKANEASRYFELNKVVSTLRTNIED